MDLRKLKDKASGAFAKGKFAKAADYYAECLQADPKDHQLRLRMGDAWAKAGRIDRAISAYQGAAEGFAKQGFLPRAIAASKLILELDPSHTGVQRMLADLYASRREPSPGPGGRRPSMGSRVPRGAIGTPPGRGHPTPIELPEEPAPQVPRQELDRRGANVAVPTPIESLPVDGAPVDLSGELPPELALPSEPLELVEVDLEEYEAPAEPRAPKPEGVSPEAAVTETSADEEGIELDLELPPLEPDPSPGTDDEPEPVAASTREPSPERFESTAGPRPSEAPRSAPEPRKSGAPPGLKRKTGGSGSDQSEPISVASREPPAASSAAPEPSRPGGPGPAGAGLRAGRRSELAESLRAFSSFDELDGLADALSASMDLDASGAASRDEGGLEGGGREAPSPVTSPLELPEAPEVAPATDLPTYARGDEAPAPAPEARQPEVSHPAPEARQVEASAAGPEAQQPRAPAPSPFTELDIEADSLLHAVELAALAASGGDVGGETEEESMADDEAPSSGLPHIPIFSDLPPDAFIQLFDRCPLHRYEPGALILEQGSIGDSFFVICGGSVRVFRDEEGARRDLATLNEGAFFGEMALLSGAPRSASVEALSEDTQVLEIGAATLAELSKEHPQVASALKRFCRQRLLTNVMNGSALFLPFDRKERKVLVERFRARDVPRGFEIVTEGKATDGLYVVLSGEVEVRKDGQPVAKLGQGELFGEMSLLNKAPATASVFAHRRTSLLRLPRKDFDEVIFSHPQVLVLIAELTEARMKQNRRQTRPDEALLV